MELDKEDIYVKYYQENMKLKTKYILKLDKESFFGGGGLCYGYLTQFTALFLSQRVCSFDQSDDTVHRH
jgi:hypothetical protein